MKYHLGLKLWSTNAQYLNEAVALWRENAIQYIELYVVPNSYAQYHKLWAATRVPFVLHCPHYNHGFNLADGHCEKDNFEMFSEVKKYANDLNVDKIVVHPGTDGSAQECSRQLQLLNDTRILIENKPYYNHDQKVCVGAKIEDLKYIFNHARVGFCLDFGHAITAANSQKIDPMQYCLELLTLKPDLFHVCDGDLSGEVDVHLHLGTGSFPLRKLFHLIPVGNQISIETDKDFPDKLSDFADDLKYLNQL